VKRGDLVCLKCNWPWQDGENFDPDIGVVIDPYIASSVSHREASWRCSIYWSSVHATLDVDAYYIEVISEAG